jgi:gamma-glutamyl hercynylcysteine S-oxide synthase
MAVAGAASSIDRAERALLAGWLRESRALTLRLLEDLEGDEQWLGPRLAIVNPPRWELGHVGWFQERWCLRDAGRLPSRCRDADALYDSATVPHKVRWDLPLPSVAETHGYVGDVLERVLAHVESGPLTEEQAYFVRLAVFHEDMHDEAFLYTRQTHGWPAPRGLAPVASPRDAGLAPGPSGDVEYAGGEFLQGARPGAHRFVFDNEKWAHPVRVAPFAMASRPVSEGEVEAFVEEGGYRRRDLWTPAGWAWREREGATAPLYWRKDAGRWWRRRFDAWVPIEPARAMVHCNAHEAEAWCAFAGRRLPTESEWEYAAGRSLPGAPRLGGEVWEWTSTDFAPYPGFTVDPYAEYSTPWFGNHRVLRGGCFATQPRLLRPTWRNFYTPDRRDVWAGMRTCRRDSA